MTTQTLETEFFDDKIARRNAIILAFAVALSSCSSVIVFTTAAIIGSMTSPYPSLVTLPITSFILGTALATIPASLLMGKIGRRFGFMLGAGLAFCGSMLATYALFQQSFWLFCLGTMLLGSYMAFAQYYRFAAADRATDAFKSRAISWVMFGGIGGAIFGPLIMMYTKEVLSPVLFAGSFVASAALALGAFGLVSLVDIPTLGSTKDNRSTRPMFEILKQPRLRVAIIAGVISYGVMNLLMTATPLAMVGCGFSVDDSAWVIQWHVLAMFGPSFFTGALIAKFGVERIIFAGLAMLVTAAIIALSGISFGHFSVSLVLLGLGWNFGFIGGTTMVTECYEPAEKSKVQAFNDFSVFAMVALVSLASGQLYTSIGWNAVNYALFPLVGVAVIALIWLHFNVRTRPVSS